MSIGVEAMRSGAFDCLEKPIYDASLVNAIARAADLAIGAPSTRRDSPANPYPHEREIFVLITSGPAEQTGGRGVTERTINADCAT